MIYLYICPCCEIKVEIDKPMALCDRIEHCEVCESELARKYEAGMIKTADGVKR